MKTYSYAFGDHTLFLRKNVCSYSSLEFAHRWGDSLNLLHVYVDADFSVSTDSCVGGKLVIVIEFNEEIFSRFYRYYMPGTPIRRADMDFNLAERYIAKLIRERSKEQK